MHLLVRGKKCIQIIIIYRYRHWVIEDIRQKVKPVYAAKLYQVPKSSLSYFIYWTNQSHGKAA